MKFNKNLYNFITSKKKYICISAVLLLLSILLMLIETLSLISLASLATLMTSNQNLFNSILGIQLKISLFEGLFLVLGIFIFKNLLSIILNYIQSKFFSSIFSEMSQTFFRSFMNSSYQINIKKKPAELIRIINSDIASAIDYIFFSFSLLKELLIIIGMFFIFYFSIGRNIVFFFILFGSLVFLFYRFFNKFLYDITKKYVNSQTKIIKLVNQALGSLKENQVYNNNFSLISNFNKNIVSVKYYNFYKVFISALAKPIFEIVAISGVVIIVIFLSITYTDSNVLLNKVILIFVLTLRIIPSFNAISSNLSGMKVSEIFFNNFFYEVSKIKNLKLNNNKKKFKLDFKKDISLKNINFRFSNKTKPILNNAEFVISKKKSIGIYGHSGSGKTTFLDLVLGLIQADNSILINNQKIEKDFFFDDKNVSYVPQNPYLLDDTIRNNIIFGRHRFKISKRQVFSALKNANLDKFIQSLPLGLETIIGTNGAFLSGGQKQRIVIARALLLDPKILVLDEATSALDENTEKYIIDEILANKNKRTIILISHKKENIEKCEIVYNLSNGILSRIK